MYNNTDLGSKVFLIIGFIFIFVVHGIRFLFIDTEDIIANCLSLVVYLPGILFVLIGTKDIYQDYLTNKYGEETYGKILSIYKSGLVVNDLDEYMADILAYLPFENKVIIINEVIGYDIKNYNEYINTYILLKQYKGDFNIEKSIEITDIPSDILAAINNKNVNEAYDEFRNKSN